LLRVQLDSIIFVVINVYNTLLSFSGYWCINACPVPLICTSQEPGIFATIIKEFDAQQGLQKQF
jgi:hypothetical protein